MIRSDPQHFGLRERDIEAPIVDFLSVENDGSYLVTFVPQDSVSPQDKESVLISRSSPEGHRVAIHLARIAGALAVVGQIVRVSHGGGSDFTFHTSGAASLSLSLAKLDTPALQRLLDELQYIAVSSEMAFLIKQRNTAA